ncbi:MAG: cell division protein SepF [Clostridia bacterium]|nr:cell division protein SepF [Clostridia bacterium]
MFDSFKNFFSPDPDDEIENEDYEEENEAAEEETPKAKESFKSSSSKKETKSQKAEDLKNLNIRIIKPGDDKTAVTTILDSLKNNQVVVVNFEETRLDVRSSFADAFFGAAYVLNAKYSKLSETTYVLAPKSVSVSPLIAEMAGSSSEETKGPKTYFSSF